jgi:Cof subfamily protein (haloacid dehalogenase superfamily)
MGAYNGGALVAPDLAILDQKFIGSETAQKALEVLYSFSIDAWIFSVDSWFVRNRRGAYVDHETSTIDTQPIIIDRLENHLDGVAKIVGVSTEPERLLFCETAMRDAIADAAFIARSQPYYLDVTPAGVDKGTFVDALIARLGIPTAEVVTLGDMENDVAMFRKSGFSIAMGNAEREVRKFADAVTRSNDEDGFADAVENLILPRAAGLSV